MAAKKSARRGKRPSRPPGPLERQFLQDLGGNVKQQRFDRGLTADELARQVGLTISTQFDREAGKVSMPAEDIARYAHALTCRPRDLVPDLVKTAAAKPAPKPAASNADASVTPEKKKRRRG